MLAQWNEQFGASFQQRAGQMDIYIQAIIINILLEKFKKINKLHSGNA